ncbi:MBL fold metallo-hydrolase [Streptomyces lydicus]|uniref:MBL fold metallo-hydrolase n=1 Tax=Streptomyces lydicus TaxID=47763 RepID=UPI002E300E81|nr:MBL fold metallo-hydrolase [Streptomyces lydicus]
MCLTCATPTGSVTRRSIFRTAAGAAGAAAFTSGAAPASAARATGAVPRRGAGVRLRWLGVAGWEMTFGGHRLLVDPYLTRQPYQDAQGKMDLAKTLQVNARIIDWVLERYLTAAPEFVLVTHGHFDHLADVAPLLNHPKWRHEQVRVLGGETHLNLLRALGVPASRTDDLLLVTGGEHLRHPLRSTESPRPAYTIEVFRSLHSQVGGYGFAPTGTLTHPPAAPSTIGDLVEGGSLGYQITVGSGPRVMFLSGTANFVEREVAGARPDVLVLGASGNAAVYDYFERVLKALGWPRVVVPSHHDDMVTPLDDPRVHDGVNRQVVDTLQDILGDRGRVLDPRHLEVLELPV